MKILHKPLFLALSLLTLSNMAQADNKGEELVKKNCASCHTLGVPTPEEMPTFKAPAMEAVLFHVKPAHKNDKEEVKKFIMDYVQNPDIKKSVCESNKVAQFGVMPSQKGKVSPEDLAIISDYLIETYPTQAFVSLIKEIKTNGKLNSLKNSPFLMNQDNLPHLTKMLIENWEKGALNLSDEQKKKLLVIRKETLTGVKKIKQELQEVEAEVLELLVDEEPLKTIQPKVDQVAQLKAQATMIQLKCLKESVEILTEEQLEYLLPFWGV
jgi:mono/diheme cytochrome c family protein/Spy/CpxP family protein refolding chaperone